MVESTDLLLADDLEKWSFLYLKNYQKNATKKDMAALPGDASARSYYRIRLTNQKTYIAAYSPPLKEKNHFFLTIAKDWLSQGIRTPVVFAADMERGFFLLEDLGPHTFFDIITQPHVDLNMFYQQAMSTLHRIQLLKPPKNIQLPVFDRAFMLKEMQLFNQWMVQEFLKKTMTPLQCQNMEKVFSFIIENALSQPYLMMHRDYHSRNLMYSKNIDLGVIDFQDIVYGPITYDIVSLLRDCYIDWSQKKVYDWLQSFVHYTPALQSISSSVLHRWFDLMGLQRHLKVVGIFIRQWVQKKNEFYLAFLPRVFSYIQYVALRYQELSFLHDWIEKDILSLLKKESWWVDHRLKE